MPRQDRSLAAPVFKLESGAMVSDNFSMPSHRRHILVCLWIAATAGLIGKAGGDRLDNYTEWGIYRGDKKGNQYAELAQVHAANVHNLEPAWVYRTDDANEKSNMHCNPIVVDGLMYLTTPTLRAVALSAGTGEEVWVFKAEGSSPGRTGIPRQKPRIGLLGIGRRQTHLSWGERPYLRHKRQNREPDPLLRPWRSYRPSPAPGSRPRKGIR